MNDFTSVISSAYVVLSANVSAWASGAIALLIAIVAAKMVVRLIKCEGGGGRSMTDAEFSQYKLDDWLERNSESDGGGQKPFLDDGGTWRTPDNWTRAQRKDWEQENL